MKSFPVVKTTYAVMYALYLGIMLVLPVLFLANGLVFEGVVGLLFWTLLFFVTVHHFIIRRIEISSDGVTNVTLFRRDHLKWSDIGIVGVSYVTIRLRKPWIYFSADNVPVSPLLPNMVSERFFMVNYRKEIIDVIKEYWTGDIVGLDELKR